MNKALCAKCLTPLEVVRPKVTVVGIDYFQEAAVMGCKKCGYEVINGFAAPVLKSSDKKTYEMIAKFAANAPVDSKEFAIIK